MFEHTDGGPLFLAIVNVLLRPPYSLFGISLDEGVIPLVSVEMRVCSKAFMHSV